MSKYRKKVSCVEKNGSKVVVVESDAEELLIQQNVTLYSNLASEHRTKSIQNVNPYEKIKQIPQYYLTKEEMSSDPVQLIAKLQKQFIDFGAVKLKACPQWQPPFSFKYSQKAITTRIQKIHRLKQGKVNLLIAAFHIRKPYLSLAFQVKQQQYNINSFASLAQNFQKDYKFKNHRLGSTRQAQFENQYWSIVNGKTPQLSPNSQKSKLTVQYAADLPAHQYGSGFPTFSNCKTIDSNFDYTNSFYNLNNIYKSPTSVLKMCDKNNQKISGITIPWVYMGMLFSSFCWHVEDLWLNSLNYSHKGSTKTWYIVPQSDKDAFDAFILKKVGHRQFLNSITFMIDPLQLIENGITVYKAYQRPHQYILTLFNAYHAGFSQGFNVGEAVNVVSIDSFNMIKKALLRNSLQKNSKPPVICYDWIVLKNVDNEYTDQQYIKRQRNQIYAYQFAKIKGFLQKFTIKTIEWIDPSHKYNKYSCCSCRFYQYVSLLKCEGCGKKYCLQHANKCCGKAFVFVSRPADELRAKTLDYVYSYLN